MEKLYRDRANAKIAGVCAGLAKRYDIDATVIRVIWAIVTLLGGSGIVAYLVCWLIIPPEPEYTEVDWYQDSKD